MLEKYFGFNNVQDEFAVVDSLIEHSRIDEEELFLLSEMVSHLCEDKLNPVADLFGKIVKIRTNSNRIFESIAEDIIHADLEHQKQYDLLRLYQRIESISENISSTGKRILMLVSVGGKLPEELRAPTQDMIGSVIQLHMEFKHALHCYQDDKKNVLKTIHRIVELESDIDRIRMESIEILYKLGNENRLLLGNFRAIENIIEHIEDLSDSIEDAATSLEWLLI
jgi:uncharacterized protein Yka (UPF0111/DUF47 family)